ncbi:MAG TPA: hypothetical protein VFO35_21925 [Steroidobacteraceae bacterium]|nr:hypothetical protein [Steroidobacteraceae bacterium]
MKPKDMVGVSASIGVSVAGLLFAPRPFHGWGGTCPWSFVFPPAGSLFPDPSFINMFDGCDAGAQYKIVLAGYLSLLFLTAGALASRIAEKPSSLRGALVNAVVFGSALLVLTVQAASDFSVLWTLVVGVAAVAGAAGLGFLGGLRRKIHA